MIKIRNKVDGILSGQRIYWNIPDSENLGAITNNAQTQLNIMYNDFGTKDEKDFLIAYIEELLKNDKEKDVNDIITKIKGIQVSNYFMFN